MKALGAIVKSAGILLFAIFQPNTCRADVPEEPSPSFCTTTLCFSIVEIDFHVERVTTIFDFEEKSEISILHLSNGIELEFKANSPNSVTECLNRTNAGIPITFPPWSNDSGCRLITINFRNSGEQPDSGLPEFIELTSPVIWGLEEFPKGIWEDGKSNRLGPPTYLCSSATEPEQLVACRTGAPNNSLKPNPYPGAPDCNTSAIFAASRRPAAGRLASGAGPMCYFITATLPKDADREALDTIAHQFGRQFQPLASPAVTAQLSPGAAYFLTTLAHCDCGTVLGSAQRAAARAPDWSGEEAKLLRKGWSRSKAARALEQRREKESLKQKAGEQADGAAAASLLGFVSGVLASGFTAELGLLLHSYRGPLNEEFRILRHEQVPPNAALADALAGAEEDVLYVFRSVV